MKKRTLLERMASAPHLVWMVLFIVAPLLFVAYYAFTDKNGKLTLQNITSLAQAAYLEVFLRSICFAFLATVICLIIAYPVSYFISRTSPQAQKILVMLVMLPQWLNFLIRTYSWMAILEDTGIINSILGIVGIELHMINTPGAVILGMVYDFLPFMIYPIYNTLQKMDTSLIEAAHDLGANRVQVFSKVTLPLSMPGIYSGIVMVFMPTVSTFAIAELLTHNKITLFGSLIQRSFGEGGIAMWNYGAALSLIMLIIIGLTSFFGGDKEDINR